jgi:hypothetical protein
MKERPILFSGAMVRAILDGTKTQTRRVIKNAPPNARCAHWARPQGDRWRGWAGALFFEGVTPESRGLASIRCPYGAPGDRLWVRETWCDSYIDPVDDRRIIGDVNEDGYVFTAYRADGWLEAPSDDGRWCPSIHMPRHRSRITLEITDVRVERVQDISRADEIAEGVAPFREDAPDELPEGIKFRAFSALWDSINDARGFGWAENPWVWVVSFRRVVP